MLEQLRIGFERCHVDDEAWRGQVTQGFKRDRGWCRCHAMNGVWDGALAVALGRRGVCGGAITLTRRPRAATNDVRDVRDVCVVHAIDSGHAVTSQGRPWMLSCSMKGSGSNCSTLNTPPLSGMLLPCHFFWSIIMAPIMVGTPVV